MLDAMSVLIFVTQKFGPFPVEADELQEFILAGDEYQLYVTPVLDAPIDTVEIGATRVESGPVG